jgi:hypothetical protein
MFSFSSETLNNLLELRMLYYSIKKRYHCQLFIFIILNYQKYIMNYEHKKLNYYSSQNIYSKIKHDYFSFI